MTGKRADRVIKPITLANTTLGPTIAMSQQPDPESLSWEDRVLIDLQAIESNAS